eukprot:5880674-Pyramimonas_sp.AAC.1
MSENTEDGFTMGEGDEPGWVKIVGLEVDVEGDNEGTKKQNQSKDKSPVRASRSLKLREGEGNRRAEI